MPTYIYIYNILYIYIYIYIYIYTMPRSMADVFYFCILCLKSTKIVFCNLFSCKHLLNSLLRFPV